MLSVTLKPAEIKKKYNEKVILQQDILSQMKKQNRHTRTFVFLNSYANNGC